MQDDTPAMDQATDDHDLMPNPTCLDDDVACDDWQRKGECERNPGFMRATCGLSCGFCSSKIKVRVQRSRVASS